MATASRLAPRDLPDVLLSEGSSWVTTAEAARRRGVPRDRVSDSLERARAAGRIVSITKGARLVRVQLNADVAADTRSRKPT